MKTTTAKAKTVSVRQLQHDFKTVLQWINEGSNILITKRKNIVAEMRAPQKKAKKIERPDFGKHLRETFSRPIPGPSNAELISMLREDRF